MKIKVCPVSGWVVEVAVCTCYEEGWKGWSPQEVVITVLANSLTVIPQTETERGGKSWLLFNRGFSAVTELAD